MEKETIVEKEPVVEKIQKKVVKELLQFNVSQGTDLNLLKQRMKVRYSAKFVEDLDNKVVFENNTNIIEMIKQ